MQSRNQIPSKWDRVDAEMRRNQLTSNAESVADDINISSSKRRNMEAEIDATPIRVFFGGEVLPVAKTPLRTCKQKTSPAEQQRADKTENASQLSTSDVRSPHSESSNTKYESPGIKAYSEAKSQPEPIANGGSIVHPAPCIVLGLTNSPRNILHYGIRRRPRKLRKPTKLVLMQKKVQQLGIVERDGSMESNGVNGGMLLAKRKRRRPANSKKKSRTVYIQAGEQRDISSSDSHNPIGAAKSVARSPDHHPVQSVGTAYDALIMDLSRGPNIPKRRRKEWPFVDVTAASPEVQTPDETIVEDNLTNTVTTEAETEQEGTMVAMSDVYRPLSIQYPENSTMGPVSDVYWPLSIQYLEKSPLAIEYTKSSPATHGTNIEEFPDKEEDKVLETVHHHPMEQITIMENDMCPSTREKENQTVETGTKCLPFVKRSPLWKVVEAMPIFKQLPQNPHFSPLNECKELCREGAALANMITFSSLAEKLSKFQLGDPRSNLESSMETLLELEKQGFNIETVRERLNSLLRINDGHECSLNHSREKEILLSEERKVKEKIDAEVSQMDQKIAELVEQRKCILLERQAKEYEMGALRSDVESWRRSMEGDLSEFERIASAPWL